MTPGAGPVQTWDPSARDYQEQMDGFLVIASRTGQSLSNIGCYQKREEAEEFARSQVKNLQWDNAWVVPAMLFFGLKRTGW